MTTNLQTFLNELLYLDLCTNFFKIWLSFFFYRVSWIMYQKTQIFFVGEVISVPTFQQYGTAFQGRAISSQSLKSEIMHRNGLKAKVDCANACGETINCKVYSISSHTKLCHRFENSPQLCDANITDPNSSVHLLLWSVCKFFNFQALSPV